MKPIKFILIVLSLMLLLNFPMESLRAQDDKATAPATNKDEISAFQNSRAWKKLGSRIQTEWLNAMTTGDPDRRLDCFVRVRAPADDGDRSFLISKGFIVQVFAGNIARGHMKAGDLVDVANLPFVDSIKLSTPSDKK